MGILVCQLYRDLFQFFPSGADPYHVSDRNLRLSFIYKYPDIKPASEGRDPCLADGLRVHAGTLLEDHGRVYTMSPHPDKFRSASIHFFIVHSRSD